MRLKTVALVSVVAVVLAAGLPAGAQQFKRGYGGDFNLLAMVHTTPYLDHDLGPQNPVPWDGAEQGGPFRYAGIPCSGNAPVNNISTNLTTYNSRLPGSRSPASTRSHPLEFTVEGPKLHGTLELTACGLRGGPTTDGVADTQRNRIFFTWEANYEQTSPEEVTWSGTFQITGGTGVYEDLRGYGRVSGYFFCFAPAGCESLDEFRDGQYAMTGKYRDETA